MTPAARPDDESLANKFRRYVAFGWLLQTPNGDVYSRHAQVRQNQRQLRRWLPHYLRVHGALAVLSGITLWGLGCLESSALVVIPCAVAFGAEACLALGLWCAWLAMKLHDRIGHSGWT